MFAVALEWFGLARWAKTDDDALDALVRYIGRYRASMGSVAKPLKEPSSVTALEIVERIHGNAGRIA